MQDMKAVEAAMAYLQLDMNLELEEYQAEVAKEFLWLDEIYETAAAAFTLKRNNLEVMPKTPSAKNNRRPRRGRKKRSTDVLEESSDLTEVRQTKLTFYEADVEEVCRPTRQTHVSKTAAAKKPATRRQIKRETGQSETGDGSVPHATLSVPPSVGDDHSPSVKKRAQAYEEMIRHHTPTSQKEKRGPSPLVSSSSVAANVPGGSTPVSRRPSKKLSRRLTRETAKASPIAKPKRTRLRLNKQQSQQVLNVVEPEKGGRSATDSSQEETTEDVNIQLETNKKKKQSKSKANEEKTKRSKSNSQTVKASMEPVLEESKTKRSKSNSKENVEVLEEPKTKRSNSQTVNVSMEPVLEEPKTKRSKSNSKENVTVLEEPKTKRSNSKSKLCEESIKETLEEPQKKRSRGSKRTKVSEDTPRGHDDMTHQAEVLPSRPKSRSKGSTKGIERDGSSPDCSSSVDPPTSRDMEPEGGQDIASESEMESEEPNSESEKMEEESSEECLGSVTEYEGGEECRQSVLSETQTIITEVYEVCEKQGRRSARLQTCEVVKTKTTPVVNAGRVATSKDIPAEEVKEVVMDQEELGDKMDVGESSGVEEPVFNSTFSKKGASADTVDTASSAASTEVRSTRTRARKQPDTTQSDSAVGSVTSATSISDTSNVGGGEVKSTRTRARKRVEETVQASTEESESAMDSCSDTDTEVKRARTRVIQKVEKEQTDCQESEPAIVSESETEVKSTRTRARKKVEEEKQDGAQEGETTTDQTIEIKSTRTRARKKVEEPEKVKEVEMAVGSTAESNDVDAGEVRSTRTRARKKAEEKEKVEAGKMNPSDARKLANNKTPTRGAKRLVEKGRGDSPAPKRARSNRMEKPQGAATPDRNYDLEARDQIMSISKVSKPYKFTNAQLTPTGFVHRTPGFSSNQGALYSFVKRTPLSNQRSGGQIKSFLAKASPSPQQSAQTLLEQRKVRLLEKQKRDEEKVKWAKELKKQMAGEKQRERDERFRRVAEARKQRDQKQLEAEQKKKQEEEDRSRKRLGMQREKEKAMEQMRLEKENQKIQVMKEKMEKERKERLEKERVEKERQERERVLEKERIKRERILEKERIERERILEKERLAKEKERKEIERQKAMQLAKEQEAAAAQRVLKQMAANQNMAGGTTTAKPGLNTTHTVETTSYQMTPLKQTTPTNKNPHNYDIDDRNSDDSSDDEEAPKKEIPGWATGPSLSTALIKQFTCPPDLTAIFGDYIPSPVLEEIFTRRKKQYKPRTSSAIWNTPPMKYC